MKVNKIISTITKVLIIVLISLVAFVGIYVKNTNTMKNAVKDYQYSMDLEGRRIISLKPCEDSETIIKDTEGNEVDEELTDEQIKEKGYTKEEKKENDDSVLTEENYEETKKIIEKRLKDLKVSNYIIRQDKATGTIYLEMPEDDSVEHTISNLSETAKFEIQDSDTNEVLLNNENLKDVRVLYNTESTGTTVFLSMEFNKEGREKLEEISKTYVKKENTTQNDEKEEENKEENQEENADNEETESKDTTTEKKIVLKIDDSEMITTSFEEPIENGMIQLSIGKETKDRDTLKDTVEKANTIATLLNNGKLPIVYELDENKYVQTDLNKEVMQNIIIAVAIAIIIAIVLMAIKYKSKGLLAAISFIGFIAIYTLIIRYTNVVITLNSLVAVFISILLNYLFNIIILNKLSNNDSTNKAIKETYKEFFTKIIPVIIICISFSFIQWIPVSSFGMTMVWGIAIIAIYNIIMTKSLLKE